MEDIQDRHRKEQKDLQAKITSKKKNATKKTRKGVNDECERLESDLRERQQAEIEALAPTNSQNDVSRSEPVELDDEAKADADINHNLAESTPSRVQYSERTFDDIPHVVAEKNKKSNRQKARLERKLADQQQQIEDAEKEAANMPDQRQQELTMMKQQMESRGLVETLIRPDGHCLYSACAHTINHTLSKDYKSVRIATADYIDAHPDEFAPYMDEPVHSYAGKIKNTAEWGGHLELKAIAEVFATTINVLQADGRVERITGEPVSDSEIWLAYYKHSFGLGEHYNALNKIAT